MRIDLSGVDSDAQKLSDNQDRFALHRKMRGERMTKRMSSDVFRDTNLPSQRDDAFSQSVASKPIALEFRKHKLTIMWHGLKNLNRILTQRHSSIFSSFCPATFSIPDVQEAGLSLDIPPLQLSKLVTSQSRIHGNLDDRTYVLVGSFGKQVDLLSAKKFSSPALHWDKAHTADRVLCKISPYDSQVEHRLDVRNCMIYCFSLNLLQTPGYKIVDKRCGYADKLKIANILRLQEARKDIAVFFVTLDARGSEVSFDILVVVNKEGAEMLTCPWCGSEITASKFDFKFCLEYFRKPLIGGFQALLNAPVSSRIGEANPPHFRVISLIYSRHICYSFATVWALKRGKVENTGLKPSAYRAPISIEILGIFSRDSQVLIASRCDRICHINAHIATVLLQFN